MVLYKALKTQYEQSGTSAELYARQNCDNAKLSDHESVTDFLTALPNLVHLVNKELSGVAGCIEDQTIAMHTIHSFPPCMRTLQMILIKATPPSNDMTWDLNNLKKEIEADKSCAQAKGENLGTKVGVLHNPKALATEQGSVMIHNTHRTC